MTEAPRSALATTRLVSVLRDLNMPGDPPRYRDVVSRFERMIDLAYSVTLSDTLRSIRRGEAVGARATHDQAPDPGELLLEARRSMIEYVLMSFSVDLSIALPFRFPTIDAHVLEDASPAAQLIQRFYVLHQSEMDFRVLRLRKALSEAIMTLRPELAHLLALDETLNATLSKQARKALAAVPRLLGRRFLDRVGDLLREHESEVTDPAQWLETGGWLAAFQLEVEELLIAELDLRLHPLFGLVEAATDTEAY